MAHILIVDDEANIRSSLKNALDKRGHECVTADSFAQGRQFALAEFDLILLDVLLGDGSGLDLLKEAMPTSIPPYRRFKPAPMILSRNRCRSTES